MGIPVAENGPWIFNLNNLCQGNDTGVGVAQKFAWTLKDSIVQFSQWSVVASSNGTSFANIGAGGDVDYWDAYTDVVEDSWVILENSVTSEQFRIECYHVDLIYIDIRYSATGAFNADGNATTPPTDSESVLLFHGALINPLPVSVVVNSMISSDGKCTRIFWNGRVNNTMETFGNVILMEEVYDAPGEWLSTYKRCVNILPIVRGGSAPSTIGPLLTDYKSHGTFDVYLKDAVPSEAHYLCSNTRIVSDLEGDADTPIADNQAYLSFQDGFSISPITLYKSSRYDGGGLGRFKDIFWAPSLGIYSFTTADDEGSREWIKWGCFLLPWDGATKPITAP